MLKKFILFLFISISSIIYANNLSRDIDIVGMPLHDVLAILSKESGKNLISSKETKDIIVDMYFLKGDDFDRVLNSLAVSYDLTFSKVDDTIIFMLPSEKNNKKAKIIGQVFSGNKILPDVKIEIQDTNKIFKTDENGNFIIDTIPKDVYLFKFSKEGFEDRGEIVSATKSINILNIELKENKEKLNDVPLEKNKIINTNFYEIDGKYYHTKTFTLYNISPDDILKILKDTFGDKIKVSSLPKVNKLVVSAEKDILENVIEIIDEMDRNPKQVKITSQILDISNNLFEELGFDWAFNHYSQGNKNGMLPSVVLDSVGIASGGKVLGSVANFSRQFNNKSDVLSLGLNLLESTNDLVVSSVPTLMIASGEEGEFKVTEEVIVGVKTQWENKKDKVSEPVFKEAGLIMKVKPSIKDDDYVILEITLELSDFKFKKNLLNIKEINSGTYNSEGGSRMGRSLTTKVKVKNGDTILLGGLKKTLQHSIENKIPILGDIPIINFFFKNSSKKKENSDMYIKLKVEIEE